MEKEKYLIRYYFLNFKNSIKTILNFAASLDSIKAIISLVVELMYVANRLNELTKKYSI